MFAYIVRRYQLTFTASPPAVDDLDHPITHNHQLHAHRSIMASYPGSELSILGLFQGLEKKLDLLAQGRIYLRVGSKTPDLALIRLDFVVTTSLPLVRAR